MINEESSWPEIATITNKYAEEIVAVVDGIWFARYPRPLYCIHDNGEEFIGLGLNELLDCYGVKPKPTRVKNPQNNGLYERMHLILCEMLRSQKLFVPKQSTATREINRILQYVVWTVRTNPNMIKNTPHAIYFLIET